jgi:hypothetical protein
MNKRVSMMIVTNKGETVCDGCGRIYRPFVRIDPESGDGIWNLEQVGYTQGVMMGDGLWDRFLMWLMPERYRTKYYCSDTCSDFGWMSLGISPPPRKGTSPHA